MMKLELWIALGGFIVVCVANIVIITKYVTGIKTEVTENFNTAINILKKDFEDKEIKQSFNFAETLKPIQTHISLYEEKHYKLELYIRDNYIEVSTFQGALRDLKDLINEIFRKVDKINEDSIEWRRNRNKTN